MGARERRGCYAKSERDRRRCIPTKNEISPRTRPRISMPSLCGPGPGAPGSGVAPAVSLWTVRSLTVCATARAAVRGVYTPTPLLVL